MAQILISKEWFIEAPWGRICILAWGNCINPPIMVCHGECDSAISFKPLMAYLPHDYYYVGIEFPGQGKSDPFPPGMPIFLMDLVYVIELVRRHFRWNSFGYMGHSIACSVGRVYNLTYRNRINRVIEFDNVKKGFPVEMNKFDKWYDQFFTKYYEKYDEYNCPVKSRPVYTWEEAIDKVVKLRGLTPETARATIERFSEPTKKPNKIRFNYDPRCKAVIFPPVSPENLKNENKFIRTPTVAIVPDNSIQIGLYENTKYLLEDSDSYKVRVVSGGHDVHIAHPDRVALFVCQFLKYGLPGLEKKKAKL